jgi:hypothetical protein
MRKSTSALDRKTLTLQGLRPAPLAPPIAIELYYLNRDFRKYRGIACAPAPGGGRAGAKGADDCQSAR